jgi:hypothetical protein
VALQADDGIFGSGIASTTSSFDKVHWVPYASTSPLLIGSEGTTTLWYRSSDNVGNIETATSTIIRVDKTPPEVAIGFSTSTKKIITVGTDALTSARIATSTTAATLSDLAGNALTLTVAKNSAKTNAASLIIPRFAYSTGTTTNATTSLRYFWTTDKKGAYTLFIAGIRTPTERLIALYVPLINKTYVVTATAADDEVDLSTQLAKLILRPILKTYNGMYIPSVLTNMGSVIINRANM